jgi:hypothetical protein
VSGGRAEGVWSRADTSWTLPTYRPFTDTPPERCGKSSDLSLEVGEV